MNTATSLRLRPDSAKFTFSSPKKNSSIKLHIREDSKFIYNQMSSTKPLKSFTQMETNQLRKLIPKRTDISPERLFQENLTLKKKINDLQESIRLQKAKGENAEKRNAKWKKRLDIQFQKELYWNQKGDYLVMGVKNQYDKLKKQYQQKCEQIKEIRRSIKYTQIQEVKVELQTYKQEVARLQKELNKFIEIYAVPYEIKGQTETSSKLLIKNLKDTIEKLQYDISTYKSGIRSIDKILKERDEKIQFLEKLVVDKDNQSYKLDQISKRFQQQNDIIKAKNKELKQKMEDEKDSINNRIQSIRGDSKRQLEKQLLVFDEQIHTKNQKISKLEAQIVYLSTLLAQWRPSQSNSIRNSIDLRTQKEGRATMIPRVQSNLALSIHEGEELVRSRQFNQHRKSYVESNSLTQSGIAKKQKNLHYSLKRDKINKQQIDNIGFQLKFRLLNKKVKFEQAKNFIKVQDGDTITIKSLLQIFSEQPFCLQSLQRRTLLARYLVEDINDSKVYYDQQNSLAVVIVRSIFEQIIPKFKIPSLTQQELIRSKVVEMLSKYNVTLTQVTSQYNKQLVLNQKKFIEILDQQELNLGQQCNDFMISHMMKSSPDITQLNFKALLSLLPQKQN